MLIRGLIVLAALDLVLLLIHGEYIIPFLQIRSNHPCTSVFLILVLELVRRVLRAPRGSRVKLFGSGVFLFLLFWALFFSNFRWRGSGDVVGASLTPFSILQDGDFYLDEYRNDFLAAEFTGRYERNGHTLTKYSSAAGVMLVPFYVIPSIAGVVPTDIFVHQLQKIGASFFVALSAVLLLTALRRKVTAPWDVLLTTGYALGTWSLSTSSQAIWQHGPSQLFIALAVLLLVRIEVDGEVRIKHGTLALLGFALGMAVWVRYSNVLFFAPVGVFLLIQRPRQVYAFALGALLPLAALAADNVMHSGSILSTGYQAEAGNFVTPFVAGLTGQLFSPGRSLFLFSPFLIFSVIGFAIAWVRPGHTTARVLSVACLAVLLFYSKWHAWEGAWCFGLRFLAGTTPALVFGITPAVGWLRRNKWARDLFALTLVLSVMMHLLGANLTWWWESQDISVWDWSRHPIGYLLGPAANSDASDQILAHRGAIVLLAVIGVWFAVHVFRSRSNAPDTRPPRSPGVGSV